MNVLSPVKSLNHTPVLQEAVGNIHTSTLKKYIKRGNGFVHLEIWANSDNLNMERLDSDVRNNWHNTSVQDYHSASEKSVISNSVNDISSIKEKAAVEDMTNQKNLAIMKIKEEKTPEVQRNGNHVPIMGTHALLSKIKAENNNVEQTNDAEIVQELVYERFSDALNYHHERSLKRKHLRAVIEDSDNSIQRKTYNSADKREKFDEYDFMHSADESNLDSSMEIVISDFSLQSSENCLERGYCDNVEYDSQRFLREALGDEYGMYDTTQSYSIRQNEIVNSSVGTSHISTLISKNSGCSYESQTTENTNGLLRENPSVALGHQNEVIAEETTKEARFQNDLIMDKLMTESLVQFQIMVQTSKALHFCQITKEFESSTELVEAEKLLLLATCRREAVLQEIQRMDYKGPLPTTENKGSVEITKLSFRTKEIVEKAKNFSHWFLCIVKSGSRVLATEVKVPDGIGNVEFDTSLTFDDLSANFEIEVAIYSMILKNAMRNYSHESKFHLNRETKNPCPNPQKFFSLNRSSRPSLPGDYLRPSSFTLWGKTTIAVGDLHKTEFKMTNVPLCSTLSDVVSVDMNVKVTIKEEIDGFLTIGTESGGLITWNRRWCSLKEAKLRYWNYPYEMDNKAPLEVIDLNSCVNAAVGTAERSVCARPRTLLLLLEFESKDKNKMNDVLVVKRFLSTDKLKEKKDWESKLNSVISTLYSWKCMKQNRSV